MGSAEDCSDDCAGQVVEMARRKAEELEDFGTASDDAAGPGAKRRRTMVRTTTERCLLTPLRLSRWLR